MVLCAGGTVHCGVYAHSAKGMRCSLHTATLHRALWTLHAAHCTLGTVHLDKRDACVLCWRRMCEQWRLTDRPRPLEPPPGNIRCGLQGRHSPWGNAGGLRAGVCCGVLCRRVTRCKVGAFGALQQQTGSQLGAHASNIFSILDPAQRVRANTLDQSV